MLPKRGEVWQVDFGITQKVRPALVISIPYADEDRALIGVIPHFTSTRGSRFEVAVPIHSTPGHGADDQEGFVPGEDGRWERGVRPFVREVFLAGIKADKRAAL